MLVVTANRGKRDPCLCLLGGRVWIGMRATFIILWHYNLMVTPTPALYWTCAHPPAPVGFSGWARNRSTKLHNKYQEIQHNQFTIRKLYLRPDKSSDLWSLLQNSFVCLSCSLQADDWLQLLVKGGLVVLFYLCSTAKKQYLTKPRNGTGQPLPQWITQVPFIWLNFFIFSFNATSYCY